MSFKYLTKLASRFEKKYVFAQNSQSQLSELAMAFREKLRDFTLSEEFLSILPTQSAREPVEGLENLISQIFDASVPDAMPADKANLSRLLATLPNQFRVAVTFLDQEKNSSNPQKLQELKSLLGTYAPMFNSVTSSSGQAK